MNYFDKFGEFDDNFFSGHKPDLINKKVIKKFQFMIDSVPQACDDITNEISIYDSLVIFYDENIKQNILLLILLFIFILFLVYRYIMKEVIKEEIYEQDNYTNINKIEDYANIIGVRDVDDPTEPDVIEDDTDDEYIEDGITRDGYIVTGDNSQDIQHRPTFNPHYPISQQTSYVNYLPNQVPLNVNNKYAIQNGQNLKEKVKYKYPYNDNTSYSHYSGAYNTYEYAQDPILPNSWGYIDDYNTTTESAVKYMTDQNRKNLNDLADVISK